MRDGKAFASLSSGLLARKGAARPAMRPQGYATPGQITDDLGWNDMGADVAPPPAPRPGMMVRLPLVPEPSPETLPIEAPAEPPVVLRQQAEIAREFAPPPPEAEPVRAAASEVVVPRPSAGGKKTAFTLRLDAERHLRLRLACAVEHRSAQQLVTRALDALLATMPEAERLAASLPPAARARRAD